MTLVTDAAQKTTPLYDEHVRLGAKMIPFGDWIMPVQYSGMLVMKLNSLGFLAVGAYSRPTEAGDSYTSLFIYGAVFVPIGLALLILLHFYLKRTKGKGLSKEWLSRRPRRK